MEKLQVLPNTSQNPGKFTLQGTNTYLVGSSPPYILIDTGEGRDAYTPLLEAALLSSIEKEQTQNSGSAACLISDIILTHRHQDHFGGLHDILKLLRKLHDHRGVETLHYIPPRIHKYLSPSATLPSSDAYESSFESVLSSLPASSYTPAPSGTPIHDLRDAQRFRLPHTPPTASEPSTLEVVHTPGHTPDSICLLLRRADAGVAGPHVLFSADTVLGQGTAIFEDLSAYISSLQRVLAARACASADADFSAIYPGHGPVVEDGPALIETYIKHRMDREAQIVRVLSGSPPPPKEGADSGDEPAWTIWNIVAVIYKDYPENLWLPAAHGVGLHLRKLEDDGRARCLGGEGVKQRWTFISES
ncbi:hypothetical protein EW145_g5827 [Phellinidium pouzarii]|uniref:Metallo-beta-lactamase domain-containing protein n=1 Tax=Phellinidium pouzarii TaxID=167371 RepID=A0A4S4L0J1_9AGAM|nr:hypothetical protein EW145_g5827 [Phellinidium pouzarii]